MIVIYPSKVNLGETATLMLESKDTIPHLVCGVDTVSALNSVAAEKGETYYLYLVKAPDTALILPQTLSSTYQIAQAEDNHTHWLTVSSEAKLIGVVEVTDVNPLTTKEGSLEAAKNQATEEMDWLDYYCLALREKMFTKRKWLLDVFTLKRTYKADGAWMIGRDDEKATYFTLRPDGRRVDIINVPTTHPVVGLFRKVTAYKGDIPNIKETVETTTGELLVNMLAFCYYFDDFKSYQSGKIMPKDFHAFYADLLKAGKLTDTKVLEKAVAATEQLSAYADFAVPAASRETMSMHPDTKKVREQGLKALGEDGIQDQAKLAELDKQLIDLDKEYVKGSPSETFFIKGKMHAVVRKKTGMLYGSEADLEGNPTPTVTTSLEEGIKIENLPSHINAVRAGANARGLKTAEGGYDMKETIRMLSAYLISEEDCKSKEGMTFLFRPEDVKLYVGRYLVGESTPLTKEQLPKLIGKMVTMRDPAYCKAEKYGLCQRCMGDALKSLKNGIAFEASTLGGAFQAKAMSATHGNALTTKYYDPDIYCS